MPADKKTAAEKRVALPRDSKKDDNFIKNWEKLSRSGKHDMHRLKEVMLLLVANDAPLPPEWKDHPLRGELDGIRECHVKGDLLLVYYIEKISGGELVVFVDAGTHSEIF
ncbi:MAG: type II toxin-antitoxin system YafQ family toxin [Synergistaceae bacterium]|nr:type II toxin-antitoxin system YafQ family toxin [Synergistaceae bacterium]